jgi:hypothetical protein
MATFKDAKGRDWLLAINVLSAGRVRKATNVDLYRLLEDEMKGLRELFDNVYVLANVAFELCRSQREEVTAEDFAGAMNGDALMEIQRALCDAIVEITPTKKRDNARKLFDRLFQLEGDAIERAGGFIDRQFDKLSQQLRDALDDDEDDADPAELRCN